MVLLPEHIITASNGCTPTGTTSFTITEPAALVAAASHTNVLCNGDNSGTATITATGGTAPYSGTGTFTN